jgi:hypothetical protein
MGSPLTSDRNQGISVVVLGMHRSGTSLASGLLGHAGVHFGDPADFITPNEENPKGFWERRDVRALNDRLLHSVGCDWSEVASFADGGIPAEVLDGFREEARAIVRHLAAGTASCVIGLKEPRFCLLLPYWLEVLGERVFYVLVHREPAEIALSLQTRNGIPPEVAHYLTEVYLGNAIRLARAGPCHIVSYPDLVQAPLEFIRAVAGRLSGLGCQLDLLNEELIRDYPSLELHRSRVTQSIIPPGETLLGWCSALDAGSLPEVSPHGPPPTAAVLSYEHRKRFEEYRRAAWQRDRLSGTLKEQQEAARELEAALDCVRSDLESSAADLRDSQFRLNVARARRVADEARIYELTNTVFQLKQDIASAERALVEQAGELGSLQQELTSKTLHIGRLEQQRQLLAKLVESLSEISRQLAERLNALGNSLSWKLVKPVLALLINPRGLGLNAVILAEIRALLEQHADWATTWRQYTVAKDTLGERAPAEPAPTFLAEPPGAGTAVRGPARVSPYRGKVSERLRSSSWSVGLVVTETSEVSGAGDFYTASELAAALKEKFGWRCILLGRNDTGRDWYDASGLDCLVVLLESYDLRKIRAPQALLKLAWIRNWTDQWVAKSWFALYDLVLCSSGRATRYVGDRTGNDARVLRIATNTERFHPAIGARPELGSDYCFTGSYWGAPRRIEGLAPAESPFEFALFGRGWQGHPQFAQSWRGSVPYADMPSVYSSTKLLVDDANHVTAPWGSVNSRVYDALACGTLVLSNGREGIEETFGDRLPTWSTIEELQRQVAHFLTHPAEREALAAEFRDTVVGRHSYRNRADELRGILLGELAARARVAMKLPFQSVDEARRHDEFHLARGLAAELRNLGYAVRLDVVPDWSAERPLADDVVLCFQGKAPYSPRDGERLLLWLTRYPGGTQRGMYDGYERILVASHCFAEQLAGETGTPVTAFLPCTSPERFPFTGHAQRSRQILFSGNAEGDVAPLLRDAIEAGLAPVVVGCGWDGLIDPSMIESEYLEGVDLAPIYAASNAVLCGHSKEAREHGFVGRRVFDVLASGGWPIADHIYGAEGIFSDLVQFYDGRPESLKHCLETVQALSFDSSELRDLLDALMNQHSFRVRAAEFDDLLFGPSEAGPGWAIGAIDSGTEG